MRGQSWTGGALPRHERRGAWVLLFIACAPFACTKLSIRNGNRVCADVCPALMHCDTNAGTCACDTPCSTAGSPACNPADATRLGICTLDAATGCPTVTGSSPCPGTAMTCPSGGTQCQCPPGQCALDSTRCDAASATVENCPADASGCGTWTLWYPCDPNYQTCVTTDATHAACQCKPVSPGCDVTTLGSDFCSSTGGPARQICTYDDSTMCYYTEPDLDCAGQSTCIATGPNNQGVCQCPSPAACTTGVPQCATGTTDTLVLCGADAGGCAVASTVSCPADYGAGSLCWSSPAPAHCACADNTGTEIFVDPVLGDDSAATGIATPPKCAFRTLTRALQAQATTMAAVDTITLRPGTYAAGETFPIHLPDHVTVQADSLADPAGYVISGSGDFAPTGGVPIAATLVYSGTGSPALKGVTIHATVGAVAFACDGGEPVLDTVVAENGPVEAVRIYAGCAPSLTNLTTRLNTNAAGIEIATSSGTTTVTSWTSDTDAPGLSVTSGQVVVNGGTVKNSWAAGGILVTGGTVSLSGLTVSNNTGGPGIAFLGASTGAIQGCTISGNGASGFAVSGLNGTIPVGGVLLATQTADSVTFAGNTIARNLGDGVDVLFSGQSLGPASCGAQSSSFYCQSAGFFGVAAASLTSGQTVTADNNQWPNHPPSSASDFNASVSVTASCTATVICPP